MGCEGEGHMLKHREALGTIWHECDCGVRTSFDMAPEGICPECDGTCIRCGSSPARHHKVEDEKGTLHRVCDLCHKKDVLLVARLNGEFDLTTFEACVLCFTVAVLLRWFVGPLSHIAKVIIGFMAMGSAVFIAQHFELARLWRRGETLAERKAHEEEQAELAERRRIWFGDQKS
jgi:hypothetical protein